MKQIESDIYYHGPVVVFDLDDTLFSEREFAVSAYREVASQPEFATQWLSRKVAEIMTEALDNGQNPFDALTLFLESCGVMSLSSVQRLVSIYRRHNPKELTLYPDARVLLDDLRLQGIKCGIITDGRSHTQRAKLRALGIEDRFDPVDILISEETGHDKRDTDNHISIVHHYPEAQRFIYIGDNPTKDFANPSLLGWDTYCLKSRGHNIHPQNNGGVDFVMIESLTDILAKPPFSSKL